MKTWQKIWLYAAIILALTHYLRDTLQDLGITNILTATFVKPGYSMVFRENQLSPYKIYWAIFNTYTIAFLQVFVFIEITLED